MIKNNTKLLKKIKTAELELRELKKISRLQNETDSKRRKICQH